MTAILGVSAFYHDSAAALLIDGKIIAAAQEERFTRKKHDLSYPFHAVEYVLKEGNFKVSELDYIVFYEKPFLKFERLLETYVSFAPKGFKSFCMSMPIWLKDKLFQKKILFNELRNILRPTFVFGLIKFCSIIFIEASSKLKSFSWANSCIVFNEVSPMDLLGLLIILSNAKSSFS